MNQISGRKASVPIEEGSGTGELDTVIIAQYFSDPLIASTTEDLRPTEEGVAEEENGQTSRLPYSAGGDAVTGATTVIACYGCQEKPARRIRISMQKIKAKLILKRLR